MLLVLESNLDARTRSSAAVWPQNTPQVLLGLRDEKQKCEQSPQLLLIIKFHNGKENSAGQSECDECINNKKVNIGSKSVK